MYKPFSESLYAFMKHGLEVGQVVLKSTHGAPPGAQKLHKATFHVVSNVHVNINDRLYHRRYRMIEDYTQYGL